MLKSQKSFNNEKKWGKKMQKGYSQMRKTMAIKHVKSGSISWVLAKLKCLMILSLLKS